MNEVHADLPRGTHTLGVLLVHGIGSQRRGDTLAEWGGAIYRWLQAAAERGPRKKGDVAVELGATSLAASDAELGVPATATIRLRQSSSSPETSWLLAESWWTESFPACTYSEFVRWALLVVPFAVVLHALPAFRRDFERYTLLLAARRSGSPSGLWVPVGGVIRPGWATGRFGSVLLRKPLFWLTLEMVARVFMRMLTSIPIVTVGALTHVALLAATALAFIPYDALRSPVRWLQQTLAATIGDSFVFLESPIKEAAIVSHVQRDLTWLSARCGIVAVVAHSQGAAVIYKALQSWAKEQRIPPNIVLLLTYGSGICKLLDLETASRQPFVWLFYGLTAELASVALLGVCVLAALGKLPLIVAVFCILLLVVIVTGVLVAACQTPLPQPKPLPLDWENFYASYDPVPNGPIELGLEPSDGGPDTSTVEYFRRLREFAQRQREVVNLRSAWGDHTSYWSSTDDFVARVARRLAELKAFLPRYISDDDWFDMSAKRRLWRVSLLSRSRILAGVGAISVLLWPTYAVAPIGSVARSFLQAWKPAVIQRSMLPAWMGDVTISDWLVGAITLGAGVYGFFLVAKLGWRIWNYLEIIDSFHRVPYSTTSLPLGVALLLFGVGSLGIIALPFAPAVVFFRNPTLTVWLAVIVSIGACGFITKTWRGQPGTSSEWGRLVLARGEWYLQQAEQLEVRSEQLSALEAADWCFGLSEVFLNVKKDSAELTRLDNRRSEARSQAGRLRSERDEEVST